MWPRLYVLIIAILVALLPISLYIAGCFIAHFADIKFSGRGNMRFGDDEPFPHWFAQLPHLPVWSMVSFPVAFIAYAMYIGAHVVATLLEEWSELRHSKKE